MSDKRTSDVKPVRPPADVVKFKLRTMLFFGLSILGLILAFGVPLIRVIRQAAFESSCRDNLEQIGRALQGYHDTWNTFPPAVVVDSRSRPMHSWRMLCVPFAMASPMYEAYDIGEPWDGPSNGRLAQGGEFSFRSKGGAAETANYLRPSYLVCPENESNSNRFETSYVVVTGPGTAFPDGGRCSFGAILDGTANTILIVEIRNSKIHWMEPRDLRIDEMSFQINDPDRPSISSRHPHSPLVCFADGLVYRIRREIPPETLRALLTINGGEPVTRNDLVAQGLLH